MIRTLGRARRAVLAAPLGAHDVIAAVSAREKLQFYARIGWKIIMHGLVLSESTFNISTTHEFIISQLPENLKRQHCDEMTAFASNRRHDPIVNKN